MKRLAPLFILSISMMPLAQEVEIEAKKFPYYDVIGMERRRSNSIEQRPRDNNEKGRHGARRRSGIKCLG